MAWGQLTDWVNGDEVTQERLNQIHENIFDNHSGVTKLMVVNEGQAYWGSISVHEVTDEDFAAFNDLSTPVSRHGNNVKILVNGTEVCSFVASTNPTDSGAGMRDVDISAELTANDLNTITVRTLYPTGTAGTFDASGATHDCVYRFWAGTELSRLSAWCRIGWFESRRPAGVGGYDADENKVYYRQNLTVIVHKDEENWT